MMPAPACIHFAIPSGSLPPCTPLSWYLSPNIGLSAGIMHAYLSPGLDFSLICSYFFPGFFFVLFSSISMHPPFGFTKTNTARLFPISDLEYKPKRLLGISNPFSENKNTSLPTDSPTA